MMTLAKGQHIFKTYVIHVTKLMFKVAFCQVCFKFSNNKLERMFNGSSQPNIFDLRKDQLSQGSYVGKFEIKLNKQ